MWYGEPLSDARTLLADFFRILLEAGYLLRLLQEVESLGLPHSRPMPVIGVRCHELRITDEDSTFRIIYRVDADAVVILDVCKKKTQQTPQSLIETCRRRLREYDQAMGL